MRKLFLPIFGSLIFLVGCSGDKKAVELDTPTSGYLAIAADEALKPIVDAEVSAFNAIYPKAHITAFYVSEGEAIDTLLKDSVRLTFVTRKLVPEERAVLENRKIRDVQVKTAIGGIALIVHPENPDSLLTMDQLSSILSGQVKSWDKISKKSSKPINVVFDRPNSGMIRYLMDSVFNLKTLPQNCFAVDSNAAVVDYVSKHPEALGLIDVSWISDEDDATTNKFRKSIRVVGLSDGGEYHQPFQAYISLKQYPLIRKIYMISSETRTGLATGFTRFVASEKGQRIILKSGLVPATMPVRIVDINRKPL